MGVYQVLNALLGMHGYTQSRLHKNILNTNYFADAAESINFNFSDAGLFGVKVAGAADQGTALLNATISELKNLTNSISNDELSRAKAILKMNAYLAFER